MKKVTFIASIVLILIGVFLININTAASTITYNTITKQSNSKVVFSPVYVDRIVIQKEYQEVIVYEEPLYKEMEVIVTAYCTEKYPHICNNGDYSSTATGTVPTVGRTIAVDPNMIPYGTQVEIDGKMYFAEDTGGSIVDNRIDILVETHQEALNFGIQEKIIKVYDNND